MTKRHSTVKLWFRRIQFKLGMIEALPGECIRRIRVAENNEAMREIVPSPKLVIQPYSSQSTMSARSGAVERLYAAAEALPAGFTLIVADAFRSRAYQEQRWEQ